MPACPSQQKVNTSAGEAAEKNWRDRAKNQALNRALKNSSSLPALRGGRHTAEELPMYNSPCRSRAPPVRGSAATRFYLFIFSCLLFYCAHGVVLFLFFVQRCALVF